MNKEKSEKITEISARIAEILEKEGVSRNDFASKLGYSRSQTVYDIVNAKSAPSYDFFNRFALSEYSEIYSLDWLLTGKGEMHKEKSEKITDQDEKNVAHPAQNPQEGIPLIPFSAMAGALTGEQTAFEYECERYVVPAFKGADFLMPIKGVSMQPTYLSGDIVACQKVAMTSIFFQWNKPYVLDTAQGPLVKRIKPGSDKEHVTIVSDNPEYDPFELPISEIHAVALVIGLIRLE
ncbi:MAG: peptidase S24 [Prevotella sp.]|nr:peptidase S24 [Prevotella sp.]